MSSSSGSSGTFTQGKSTLLLLKLHQSLARTFGERVSDSYNSKANYYDLNELPYVSQMKSMLLILCASTFMIAPIAYMPLAQIQAAFDHKCFLYTNVRLHTTGNVDNRTSQQEILALDPVATQWGPTSACDLTTFVPVSVSIFSTIIAMSTFTIWPTLMSLGRGGALMITYALMAVMSLIACGVSIAVLNDGYNQTCENLRDETKYFKEDGIPCSSLNNIDIVIPEVRFSHIAKNVHRVMVVATIILWCLLGLMLSIVCISVLTFSIIWIYINSD
ncbi:hypothetical protein BsWGS_14614 [Bradybaena similaris]